MVVKLAGGIGSDTTPVVAEDHIHHPMQAVLDRPMTADDRPQKIGQQDQRRDVKPRLPLDLSAPHACCREFTDALDHDNAREAGPVVAFLQPGDVVDDGGGSGLDAAVVAIDGLSLADGGVGEAAGFLLGHEDFDILAQRSLIALQRQNVIGFLVAEAGDIDEGFRPGQHRKQAHGQHLVERIGHFAALARVRQVVEIP